MANFKALGLWNNLDEAHTTTHFHFKFSDSLFIQAVEPCLILEPLGSPQMRISVQNMSQHYQGDSQEYVKQRETIGMQNTALANAQIPTLQTSCLHSHFCHQNHKAVWWKEWRAAQDREDHQNHPMLTRSSTITYQKDLSASTSPNVFTSRSCKPDHSCLHKSSFSLHPCPIPFSLQKVSDRRYRDPLVISYTDSLIVKLRRSIFLLVCKNPAES